MTDVVDPEPIIEARLRSLAAKHEPRIAELERAVAGGQSGEAKKNLRRAKRAYAAARRQVRKLRGPGVTW